MVFRFVLTKLSKGQIPKTVLKYEWSTDKEDSIKEFEEKVTVGSLTVTGHYDEKKNVTKIEKKIKGDTEKEGDELEGVKENLSGLVIIGIKTESGIISIDY